MFPTINALQYFVSGHKGGSVAELVVTPVHLELVEQDLSVPLMIFLRVQILEIIHFSS